MWDLIRDLFGGFFKDRGESLEPLARVIGRPLADSLTSAGRIPSQLLSRLAAESDLASFVKFINCPALAGAAVKAGRLFLPEAPTFRRAKRKTLAFTPAEVTAISDSDSESLQRAVYPLVKGRTSAPRERDVFVIGRGTGCDIAIPDFAISERHARIQLSGGNYSITDLGSTNGTTLNGEAITRRPRPLNDNDVVIFGRLEFVFVHPESLYRLMTAQR